MPEPITTTSYDANNRLLTFGDKTLTYDDNGNLQSISDSNGTTLYQWNARNQLVGISGPTVNASFVYDGLGRREAKTINGNLTEFLYDGLNPVQETSGAAILANILPGLGIDEFLTRTDAVAGVTSNFLSDALGSPVAVADNSGVVQTEYTYEPFGRTVATGASNSNSYQYTGRENDGTGLYYYRARFHHPQLQRFLGEDPLGFDGGDFNLYSYVRNNPQNFTDPLGTYVLMPGNPATNSMISCLACGWRTYNDANTRIGRGPGKNHMRHCWASCTAAKRCGYNCSLSLGILNEILGSRSPEDYAANRDGLKCSEKQQCGAGPSDKNGCEACCKEMAP